MNNEMKKFFFLKKYKYILKKKHYDDPVKDSKTVDSMRRRTEN